LVWLDRKLAEIARRVGVKVMEVEG
jgi:hypothetical protein